MKYLLILLCLLSLKPSAQELQETRFYESFFSFNPLAVAEPNMAVGAGFGKRFTKRSSYFGELSYLFTNPFYKEMPGTLTGFRFIGQYRYHLNRFGGGIFRFGSYGHQSFMALELRAKPYRFFRSGDFINTIQGDTLFNYTYNARAIVLGAAFLFGNIFNLSADGRWQLESSVGLGIKQKRVDFKNPKPPYAIAVLGVREWGFVPRIYEEAVTLNLPFAVRMRYNLH
jgi:hypothetical protein